MDVRDRAQHQREEQHIVGAPLRPSVADSVEKKTGGNLSVLLRGSETHSGSSRFTSYSLGKRLIWEEAIILAKEEKAQKACKTRGTESSQKSD